MISDNDIRRWGIEYYIFIRVGDGGYHDLFRRANVISDDIIHRDRINRDKRLLAIE